MSWLRRWIEVVLSDLNSSFYSLQTIEFAVYVVWSREYFPVCVTKQIYNQYILFLCNRLCKVTDDGVNGTSCHFRNSSLVFVIRVLDCCWRRIGRYAVFKVPVVQWRKWIFQSPLLPSSHLSTCIKITLTAVFPIGVKLCAPVWQKK